jgi:TetR/AcrR family transcriptional regulator, mexJK operon transcriptional repressor
MSRRKPSERSRAMRAAILAGARRLFLAHGFERTSMDAVAAAIGASKMTVYRHFRSKEALFAGTVSASCDAVADPDLARAMVRLPLRRALEMFGRRSLETIFDPETLGLHRLVIAESARFPELGRMFYDRGPATNVATLAAYLARNAALGAEEAERIAGEFMSLLRGYEHMRALLGLGAALSRRERERQILRAVDHVLDKLR